MCSIPIDVQSIASEPDYLGLNLYIPQAHSREVLATSFPCALVSSPVKWDNTVLNRWNCSKKENSYIPRAWDGTWHIVSY